MVTITRAYLKDLNSGSYPVREHRIMIEIDGKVDHNQFRYEERDGLYRAEDESGIASFFSYDGPSRGFGGAQWYIHMVDGPDRLLIGPWSSRCGVVNREYPDREPLVECVCDCTVTYVRKDVLEALGIPLVREDKWESEIYYRPVIETLATI